MTAKEVVQSLVKRFEGLRLVSYLCPAGVWTNGYGSTGKDVIKGTVWTKEKAEERMQEDTNVHLIASKNLCPQIENEVHGAIADFSYNLGATRLAGSTLRKRINKQDWDGARYEIKKWIFGGGRKLPGLVIRRYEESKHFCK